MRAIVIGAVLGGFLALPHQAGAQEVAIDAETDCVAEVHASLQLASLRSEVVSAGEGATPSVPERAPQQERADEQAETGDRERANQQADEATALPSGRAVGRLGEEACLAALSSYGVTYSRLPTEGTEGVGIPIRLEGALGGVRVSSRGHSELHEILDCRLAVALLSWAPRLRAAGVNWIEHYSTYRPGARVARSGRRSGHARALAIDLAFLHMDDGTQLEVLNAWEARDRGSLPCEGEHDESESSARLRQLVCDVAGSELFQVVLTPHYDGAHANHIHLELVPDVPWSYVR